MKSPISLGLILILISLSGCVRGSRPWEIPLEPGELSKGYQFQGERGIEKLNREEKSAPDGEAKGESYPIDLSTALRLAGARHLEIALVKEKVHEAYAKTLLAQEDLFPILIPAFSFRRHEGLTQKTEGPFIDVDKQSTFLGGDFGFKWDLGESIFSNLAARQRLKASYQELEKATDQAILEAALSYFDLLEAREKVKVAEEAAAISERLVRQTEVWVELGAGFKGDVLRAKAQLAHNRLNLLRVQDEFRVASIRLATILRLDPQTQLNPTDPVVTTIDLIPQDKSADQLIQKALTQRPEVKEVRFQVNAFQQERKRTIWGPLIPSFHFGGSPIGGIGFTPGNLSSSEDYNFFLGWRIGPGGLFDQGRKETAEAAYKRAELQLIRIRETVAQEVMIVHTNLKTQLEQIVIAQQEVEEAEESLRLNQERQRMGAGLPLEVIQAEEALTRARIDLISAKIAYNKAQYRLFTAIGGEV